MMKDIENLDSIRLLVDEFYKKVRQDQTIGPIFIMVINDDWVPHLEKMYAFWNAALFGVPGYRGNPFARHAPLPIAPVHFQKWLELFGETIDANFQGIVAEDAKRRAGIMADTFMSKLAFLNDPSKVIV